MGRNARSLLKLILASVLWAGFVFRADAQGFGAGGITKSGSGTLILNGADTGGFTVTDTNTSTGGTITGLSGVVPNNGIFTGGNTNTGGNSIPGANIYTGSLTITGGFTATGGVTTGGVGTFTLNNHVFGSFPGSLAVSPGATFTVVDTTNLPSSLTLDAGSTLQLSVDTLTALANTLSIAGNLNLNGTKLIVTDLAGTSQAVPEGTTFALIHYGGTETGEFVINGVPIPNGGTFTLGKNEFVIDYAAGDPNVEITAVPEPSTWMMMAGGISLLACWRRVKRPLSK